MLKQHSSILVGGQQAIILAALVLCVSLQPAYGQINDPALLLQQSPADGGTITPAVGVHKLEFGSEVTLTAVPKPGYQFVYWMGDVSDPAASNTTVYLDGPKIIIAVFERAEFEALVVEAASHIAPGGGLFRSISQATQAGFGGPGGKRRQGIRVPEEPPDDDDDQGEDFPVPEGEDFPVPEGGEDFPVPAIPEPATVLLLGLGSLALLRKRRP
ncbi:MAG: PEP-CTERM sorting domain-containing protein [Planctomycetota bacterium]|nr:MAG: PEP-CTERM sorting domain-containing protein [Planctomycetota bacterium]